MILAAVVIVWCSSIRAKAQDGNISPGPDGRLSGMDHRVALTWITQKGRYAPGNYGRRIRVDGRQRYYEVHLPPGYSPDTPMPVVMVLHGGGGYATLMRFQTGMDSVADRNGFIAVYPGGSGIRFPDRQLFWNAGYATTNPGFAAIDDVGFLTTVSKEVVTVFNADASRVYITGMSNGAQMCLKVAAERPNVFAAVAAVGAVRGTDEFAMAEGRRVPIAMFKGRDDNFGPFEGTDVKPAGRRSRMFHPYRVPSFDKAVRSWATWNQCEAQPEIQRIGNAERRLYRSKAGADVVGWILNDGGHTWPGGQSTRFEQRLGVGQINRDIVASQTMWEFFKRHRLPATQVVVP